MDRDEFVEVVEPLPFDKADLRFARWLEANHLRREDMRDEDIRIDTVRSLTGGSLRRYMLRRSALEQASLAMTLSDWGKRLITALEEDRRVPVAERDTGADDAQIGWAVKLVTKMVRQIENESLPPAEQRFPELTHLMADAWRPRSRLAEELSRFEALYCGYGIGKSNV